MKSWFTFGQSHRHEIQGKVFDKDTIVEIESVNPRETMYAYFGDKWATEYTYYPSQLDIGCYYKGGIIVLDTTIPPEPHKTRHYVGDGIYVDIHPNGEVILLTSNGEEDTNLIYFGEREIDSLVAILQKHRS